MNQPSLIPDSHALPWVAIPTSRDNNVGGTVTKRLAEDPATGGATLICWFEADELAA